MRFRRMVVNGSVLVRVQIGFGTKPVKEKLESYTNSVPFQNQLLDSGIGTIIIYRTDLDLGLNLGRK